MNKEEFINRITEFYCSNMPNDIDYVLLTKCDYERNRNEYETIDKYQNNWNELKKYLIKEQARIVIENTNEDEFVYTDLLDKMQSLERGEE